MDIHWHRDDLRATDNDGLAAAGADGEALPVFVFDDRVLQHGSPPRVAFMLDSLAELREWYRDRGGDLYVARGDPTAILPDLAVEHGVDTVHCNAGYSGLARDRD